MREKNVSKMKTNWAGMVSVSALALVVSSGLAYSASMDDLVAAAKKEGQLTVIALPHDWCAYGAVIDAFRAKYGLTVNELNPDAGSGDEVEAIKAIVVTPEGHLVQGFRPRNFVFSLEIEESKIVLTHAAVY